jgi:hypothetical protein
VDVKAADHSDGEGDDGGAGAGAESDADAEGEGEGDEEGEGEGEVDASASDDGGSDASAREREEASSGDDDDDDNDGGGEVAADLDGASHGSTEADTPGSPLGRHGVAAQAAASEVEFVAPDSPVRSGVVGITEADAARLQAARIRESESQPSASPARSDAATGGRSTDTPTRSKEQSPRRQQLRVGSGDSGRLHADASAANGSSAISAEGVATRGDALPAADGGAVSAPALSAIAALVEQDEHRINAIEASLVRLLQARVFGVPNSSAGGGGGGSGSGAGAGVGGGGGAGASNVTTPTSGDLVSPSSCASDGDGAPTAADAETLQAHVVALRRTIAGQTVSCTRGSQSRLV